MEELKQKIKDIEAKLKADHENNKKLFENKESKGYNINIMKYEHKEWDIEDETYENMVSIMDEIKKFKTDNEWLPMLKGKVIAIAERDFDTAYIDAVLFEFRWKEPDENILANEIDRQIRILVSQYFDIPNYRLNCSSIELLLSDKIDEETFKELNKGYC